MIFYIFVKNGFSRRLAEARGGSRRLAEAGENLLFKEK